MMRMLTAVAASGDEATPSRTRPRLSGPAPGNGSYDDGFEQISPGTVTYRPGEGETPQDNDGRGRHHSTSTLANSMMRTVVSSGNDALNILFEAAAAAHNQETGRDLQDTHARGLQDADLTTGSGGSVNGGHSAGPEVVPKVVLPVELADASKEVLNVWETCRFVKMGWFTSREAVTFIDWFAF